MSSWAHPREAVAKLKSAAIAFTVITAVICGLTVAIVRFPQVTTVSAGAIVIVSLLARQREADKEVKRAREELHDSNERFKARLAERVEEVMTEVVIERDLAISELATEHIEATKSIEAAESKAAIAVRDLAGAVTACKRADLTGQLLILAGQWVVARRLKPTAKKPIKKVGGVELSADYYMNRFLDVLKLRWPSHTWAPDQTLALLEEFSSRADLTRWRWLLSTDIPPAV